MEFCSTEVTLCNSFSFICHLSAFGQGPQKADIASLRAAGLDPGHIRRAATASRDGVARRECVRSRPPVHHTDNSLLTMEAARPGGQPEAQHPDHEPPVPTYVPANEPAR